MRTTRPPMDVMERCALAYLITGNRRLGQEAKRRLLHFFSWDPDGPTSFFAYDEPPMWMMMRGTRAYDWTYDLFTPEERAKIEANMQVRAGQFLKHLQRLPFESNPYDSHAGPAAGVPGRVRAVVHPRVARSAGVAGVRDAAVLHVVSGLGRRRRRLAGRARLLGRLHAVRPALRGGPARGDRRGPDAEAVLPQHAVLRPVHGHAVPPAQPVRRRPDRQPARPGPRDVRLLDADAEPVLPLACRGVEGRRSGRTC